MHNEPGLAGRILASPPARSVAAADELHVRLLRGAGAATRRQPHKRFIDPCAAWRHSHGACRPWPAAPYPLLPIKSVVVSNLRDETPESAATNVVDDTVTFAAPSARVDEGRARIWTEVRSSRIVQSTAAPMDAQPENHL